MADELGVDAAFAHAPGNQLRVLPAEVDDENGTLFWLRLRRGERNDLAQALVARLVGLPRLWRAKSERGKDAGSPRHVGD